MSLHLHHSTSTKHTNTKRSRTARSNTWLYVSVTLAVLLILGGLSGLWLTNQTSSSDQAPAGQFTTPSSKVVEAPDFTLQTLDGRTVKLSDYRGQVILLNTFATWCPPCRAEMSDLEAYYREHQKDGFVVLAVNDEESASTVGNFVKAQGFTFPVLLDPDGKVLGQYGVRGLPTSFFIDRKGMVRGVWSGQLSPARLKEIADPLL
jgi:cytochrome c biogenesis protein CcmG/thiol:disulfide interchange protein DsbE